MTLIDFKSYYNAVVLKESAMQTKRQINTIGCEGQ